jgi:hypothetical protein
MEWLFRCGYGTGTGCSGVFMAQELVAQVCYGRETGYADVLWYRNWLFRYDMAQETVV